MISNKYEKNNFGPSQNLCTKKCEQMVLCIFWTPKNTCPTSCEKMVGGRPGPGLKTGAGAQGPGPGQGPGPWPGPRAWPLARAMGPGPWPWALRQFLSLGLVSRSPFFHNFLGMCFLESKKYPRPFFHNFWGIGFGKAQDIFSQLFGHRFWEGPKHVFTISDIWPCRGTRHP